MDLKKVAERLGGDVNQLTKEYEKIAGTLGKLGLSEYESRAYLALVALGSSTANFVAEAAQIPRTSAYKVMESLEQKGFARKLPGKPVSFAPVDPDDLSKRLLGEGGGGFSKISAARDLLSHRGVPPP